MPRSWPYTELRNGKKRGIDQSETSSHLTHLIYSGIPLIAMQYNIHNTRLQCARSACAVGTGLTRPFHDDN